MGIVQAEGIVTREVKYGDTSRILTVLTKEFGKISVLAGGVRTNKSGLLAATQLFSHVSFQLFQGKERSLYKINSGEILTSFSSIRQSLEKMAYASYFCEVANSVIQENAPDEEELALLLNALYLLSKDALTAEQIKGVFEFRTLAIEGLLPNTALCGRCGKEEAAFFHVLSGAAACEGCAKTLPEGAVHAGKGVLSAIAYIAAADGKKVFSFSLPEGAMQYLSRLGEYCVECYLERHFKTLDYLKKVCELGG